MQFCMVPYNLLNRKAAYLETGTWAVNAIKEAKLFGEVDVVASSKEANFSYIPKGYTVPDDVDYFHLRHDLLTQGCQILQRHGAGMDDRYLFHRNFSQ